MSWAMPLASLPTLSIRLGRGAESWEGLPHRNCSSSFLRSGLLAFEVPDRPAPFFLPLRTASFHHVQRRQPAMVSTPGCALSPFRSRSAEVLSWIPWGGGAFLCQGIGHLEDLNGFKGLLQNDASGPAGGSSSCISLQEQL